MYKKIIRTKTRAKLQALPPFEKKRQEAKIHANLFQTAEWKAARVVAATLSQDFEVSTAGIIEKGWEAGKIIVLPRSKEDLTMDFVPFEKRTPLVLSKFGINEPAPYLDGVSKESIDLVIVPGLAYSLNGFRIGFGGGYYDRFLLDYSGKTASLVLEEQKIEDWDVEPFDIPVQLLITQDQVIHINPMLKNEC